MDEILDEASLPRRYTAYTPCFRREKMSAGRDVRGIKRGHQFDKVEMYIYCKPEESDAWLEKMLAHAEETCTALGLTHRVKQLCTGDIGFSAAITYDVEVWAPGCAEWLEVSSVSNCRDFQARRASIKYRTAEKGKTRLVHTLNGSGLGLPRTLIAVMENYQQADGSIVVPEVLRPWMGGVGSVIKLIGRHGRSDRHECRRRAIQSSASANHMPIDPTTLGESILQALTLGVLLVGLFGLLDPGVPRPAYHVAGDRFYALLESAAGPDGLDRLDALRADHHPDGHRKRDRQHHHRPARCAASPFPGRPLVWPSWRGWSPAYFFTPVVGIVASPLALFGAEWLRLRHGEAGLCLGEELHGRVGLVVCRRLRRRRLDDRAVAAVGDVLSSKSF